MQTLSQSWCSGVIFPKSYGVQRHAGVKPEERSNTGRQISEAAGEIQVQETVEQSKTQKALGNTRGDTGDIEDGYQKRQERSKARKSEAKVNLQNKPGNTELNSKP